MDSDPDGAVQYARAQAEMESPKSCCSVMVDRLNRVDRDVMPTA